ncbi:MAG: class I SAM-dependent methyltransferase [Verrucomicrobia bacterium]|nr:class I SAM-dependent methyltransferase [Verrucomicrobiota bacterium]
MISRQAIDQKTKPLPSAGEIPIKIETDSGQPRHFSLGSRARKRSTSYGEEFFVGQKDLSYHSATQIIPIVQQLVPVRSVCDVGCGVGTWLRAFHEAGVQDLVGVDGFYVDKSSLQIPVSAFHEADLRQPLRLDRSFDITISMEVAEHLPASRSTSFVEDLTRLSPVILFSAAIPRQGGTAHINEQWQSYWAAIFNQYDFVTCDVLRPMIWDNPHIARWYRQNALLFCRRDFLPQVPGLMVEGVNTFPLSVVHPQQYFEIWDELNVRRSLQLLRLAVQRAFHRRMQRWLRTLGGVLTMRGQKTQVRD